MSAKSDTQTSVVLLFGAGASYGSGGIWRRPPLGKDLYRSLTQEHPETWGKLSPDTRRSFLDSDGRLDFEKGMGNLLECEMRREISNLGDLQKDMAEFFSKFAIDRIHNNQYFKIFSRFRDRLVSGEVVLATLNYDCLIEHALARAGLSVDYFDGSSGARLLKLHGSCNFIWPGMRGKGKVVFSSMTFEGSFTAVDPQMVCSILDDMPVPPAMSLFNTDKTDIVCPTQIWELREQYSKSVGKAKLVVVVGVNPRLSGDSHVWSPLISMPGKLGIVDKVESVDRWRAVNRSDRADPILPEEFIPAYEGICSLMESVL